jgi:cytidylate kinase
MGLVVTIGGPHGTGKSTYAKMIAKQLKLRYISAGKMFRDLAKEKGLSLEELSRQAAESPEIDNLIDERSAVEAAKGNAVIEGQLAAWMAKDSAHVRIYVRASDEARIGRIARRDHLDYETARTQTVEREKIQRDRYKRYYGINIDDLTPYNIIVDTTDRSVESTSAELMSKIRHILNRDRSAEV